MITHRDDPKAGVRSLIPVYEIGLHRKKNPYLNDVEFQRALAAVGRLVFSEHVFARMVRSSLYCKMARVCISSKMCLVLSWKWKRILPIP